MTAPLSHRTAVLAIILVSYLMLVLDISIAITELPKIRDGLGLSAAGLSWVQNAYTLAFGGLLLLGARAGDILGRRRMFVAGLALFTAASLAIGLAQSPAWLIGARALQGVGAAVLAPSTLALLSTNFPEGPQRTRAVAYYGAVAGVGASTGLVLGGFLADLLSWRVGFFINLPIGIALMLAALRYLAVTDRRAGQLDLTGALSSTFGMTTLVYGIVRSAVAGWSDPVTIALLIAGVLLLALFVLNESRAKQPIMPLRLFASRERVGAYAARVLFLGSMMGFWFFTTQFLRTVSGFSPLVNVAHQLGGSLGLGVLVAAFAAAGGAVDVRELLAHRVATSLVAGTVMLAVALVLVVGLIVRRRTAPEAELPDLVEQRAS
jgi:MFS family permease